MARAMKICTRCPTPIPIGTSLCPACKAQANRARRPTGNPYSTAGHRAFRAAVLAKNPICVLCRKRRATVADHYPMERTDLIERGLDPNDPKHGRGLCKQCHDEWTAVSHPGGWNERE